MKLRILIDFIDFGGFSHRTNAQETVMEDSQSVRLVPSAPLGSFLNVCPIHSVPSERAWLLELPVTRLTSLVIKIRLLHTY